MIFFVIYTFTRELKINNNNKRRCIHRSSITPPPKERLLFYICFDRRVCGKIVVIFFLVIYPYFRPLRSRRKRRVTERKHILRTVYSRVGEVNKNSKTTNRSNNRLRISYYLQQQIRPHKTRAKQTVLRKLTFFFWRRPFRVEGRVTTNASESRARVMVVIAVAATCDLMIRFSSLQKRKQRP